MGVEPTYPAWKAGALADVLHPHIREGSAYVFPQLIGKRLEKSYN